MCDTSEKITSKTSRSVKPATSGKRSFKAAQKRKPTKQLSSTSSVNAAATEEMLVITTTIKTIYIQTVLSILLLYVYTCFNIVLYVEITIT